MKEAKKLDSIKMEFPSVSYGIQEKEIFSDMHLLFK